MCKISCVTPIADTRICSDCFWVADILTGRYLELHMVSVQVPLQLGHNYIVWLSIPFEWLHLCSCTEMFQLQ